MVSATAWGKLTAAMTSSYERLSATDAGFLLLEDAGAHMHVGAVAIMDDLPAGVDEASHLADLRSRLTALVAHTPRLRQRISKVPGFGTPVWTDARRFSIAEHVRETRLSAPGDEAALSALASRIFSTRLDRARPLWEMWLVGGVAGAGFAIVFKVHHCLLDGMGGVHLMQALMVARAGQPVPIPTPEAVAPSDLVRGELRHRLEGVRTLARRAQTAWQERTGPGGERVPLWQGLRGALGTALSSASDTPLNPRSIRDERLFATLRTDLAQTKHIKNRLGCTINDVVLAVVTGALRSYFRQRGTDPDRIQRFRALVPNNLRRGASDAGLGNRVTPLFAALPLAEPDRRTRLARVREETAYLKAGSGQAHATKFIADVDDALGSHLGTSTLRLSVALRGFNTVVSNVPGPPMAVPMLGTQLRALYPLVPLFQRQGFGLAVFSYAGGLHWGLHADRAVVDDLEPLRKAIVEELDAFEELAAT